MKSKMARCQVCDKTTTFGRNVSHSKRHTSRKFLPNLKRRRLEINGASVRVVICTRCLRTQHKMRGA